MEFKEETISSKRIFKGRIVGLREDTVKLPDGMVAKREIVEHPGAVTVVALTEKNEIVLVKQYRKPAEDVLLELPAGLAKKGEKGVDAAKRELEEETGFVAKNIRKVMEGYSSPGYSTEVIKFYLATDMTLSEQKGDDDERIEVKLLKVEDAGKLIKSGEIRDNKTIIGINLAMNIKEYL
ncbi:NUDIX hydrolase [Candidatus Margulisiibacteriota bacterium]